MNEMALDEEVLRVLRHGGWEANKNFRKVAIGPDGKGIVPDVVAVRGDRKVFVENKVNGQQVGTLHEKWVLAAIKLSNACLANGHEGVLVIDDRSGKLGRFIDYYVKPTATLLGIEVFSLEEFHDFATR